MQSSSSRWHAAWDEGIDPLLAESMTAAKHTRAIVATVAASAAAVGAVARRDKHCMGATHSAV